jgi:hypothetical protein
MLGKFKRGDMQGILNGFNGVFIETSPALDKLIPALILLQSQLGPIPRDSMGQRGKYASLASVHKEVRPALLGADFATTSTMCVLPDCSSGLQFTLWHASGQWIRGTMPLLLAKDDAQSQGGAITYARRYCLQAMIDSVTEDDDAEQATNSRQDYQSRQPTQPQTRTPSAPKAQAPNCPACSSTNTMKSIVDKGYYCRDCRCSYEMQETSATT